MVTDGARTEKQLCGDLLVRHPGGGQPDDLNFLRRQRFQWISDGTDGLVTERGQLHPGALCPARGADLFEAAQRVQQRGAGFGASAVPTQPLAEQQPGARGVVAAGGQFEGGPVRRLGVVEQAAGTQPQATPDLTGLAASYDDSAARLLKLSRSEHVDAQGAASLTSMAVAHWLTARQLTGRLVQVGQPAVWMPPSMTGLSAASDSGVVSRSP